MSMPPAISNNPAARFLESAPTSRPKGYSESNQVRVRAAVTKRSEAPQVAKALNRLDKVLDSGKDLKTEVPRGFYINIQV